MRATAVLFTAMIGMAARSHVGLGPRLPPPRLAQTRAAPSHDSDRSTEVTRHCAVDVDCRDGRRRGHCFTLALAAQYTQAFQDCADGRTWRAAHDPGTCVFDECSADAMGANDTCAAGMRCGTLDMVPFPQRVCVTAACTSDFQCRRQAGGRCASYFNAGRCQRGGWACSYPADVCAPRDPHRMCPVHPGLLPYCAPREGRFVCVQDPAVPPAASSGS